MSLDVVILGVFMADTSHRAERMPRLGETIRGTSFALGPGGKGSNQAVAAARAGARWAWSDAAWGRDAFADMALKIWTEAGVTPLVTQHDSDHPTGSAFIFVDDATGDNAIIISPGVAETISAADIDERAEEISRAKRLRDAAGTAARRRAPGAGDRPGRRHADRFSTPRRPVTSTGRGPAALRLRHAERDRGFRPQRHCGADVTSAAEAGAALLARGVRKACIVTLGDQGCLWCDGGTPVHVPAMTAGPLVETTGAGDAFNGGLAVALAEGMSRDAALRFATATAAISVTRPGTAPSMPERAEIDARLAGY
jgi:ribokinase